MENKRTIKAEGDFPFLFYIEKAIPAEENGQMVVTGIASTVNIDHDNERMAKEALTAMANIINEKSVPLRFEHQKAENAIVGQVFKGWVDERNQLWIKASLDPHNASGPILYKALKDGVKYGLSVGGRVKRAMQEFSEKTGKMVKTFYDVVLDEVSMTRRPANYDAWLFAKSIAKDGEDTSKFYGTSFFNQFLFENPQLDYIQAFAKSIPDKAWQRVELPKKEIKNLNNKMKKTETKIDEELDKTEEEPKEEATKYASLTDFNSLKSMMVKGFEAVTEVLNKMTKDYSAEQTTDHPDIPAGFEEGKPEQDRDTTDHPEQKTTKQREGQETGEETGGQHTEEVKPEVGATANKSETDVTTEETKNPVGSSANKNMKKDIHVHVGEDKTKTDTETTTETGSETKTDSETGTEDKKDDKKEYGAEYQMKSSIERLKSISKRMVKTEDKKEETETTEKSFKGVPTIDLFVAAITEAVEKIAKRMEDKGVRVPGFEKHIVDLIKDNPAMQEEIRKMMREPGAKKSVSLGTPFMVTKEGKRFALVAQDTEVKKSEGEDKRNFKDLYKSDFASFK